MLRVNPLARARLAGVAVVLAAAPGCERETGSAAAACRIQRGSPVPARVAADVPVREAPGWRLIAAGDRLSPRSGHAAVWTGDEMVVWGSAGAPPADDGAAYDPSADAWRLLPRAPLEPIVPRATWTGDEMIVWGSFEWSSIRGCERPPASAGAAYDPAAHSWRPLSDAPVVLLGDRAQVWTGDEMIVWGATRPRGVELAGAAYDPSGDSWRALARPPFPLGLESPAAVWADGEMIVWGASPDSFFGRGAAYDPERDRWRGVPRSPLPVRRGHTAVWTGEEMIVWGGMAGWGEDHLTVDGAAYDPVADRWRVLARPFGTGLRRGLREHRAVWTGREMLVWGRAGEAPADSVAAAAYDPETDTWRRLPAGPLDPRSGFSLVWTGEEMIVWGGLPTESDVSSGVQGAAYDPGPAAEV